MLLSPRLPTVVAMFVLAAVTFEVVSAGTIPISPAEGRRIVIDVMDPFKPRVGAYIVQTFEDVPRLASDASTKAPIAVVIGDSRIAAVPGVFSNCTADSTTLTIRCDLRLLDDLIDEFALLRNEDQRIEAREHILQMVLAHELGHIFNHDGSAAYHGTKNGFSVFRYANYKTELRADAFAVNLIDRYARSRDMEYGTIVDLAYNALAKSLCPDSFPRPCPCPGYTDASLCSRVAAGPGLPMSKDAQVPVTLAGTHPEYVVRFARLLYLTRDPKAHEFYSREAQEVLRHVLVRDEGDQLEDASALLGPENTGPKH